MTFTEHLEELRRRIIVCLSTVFIIAVILFFNSENILRHLIRLIDGLVFIAPQELFIVYVKISVFGAIFLSLPVIIYHIWKFIAVGLTKKEEKTIFIYMILSLLFAVIGFSFSYFIVVPLAMHFLLGFATYKISPMISVNSYVTFYSVLILVFTVIFEFPIFLLGMNRLGIISLNGLITKRKFIYAGAFIVSAIVTPPDVVTQFLSAVPIIILYELSIILMRIKKRGKNENQIESTV